MKYLVVWSQRLKDRAFIGFTNCETIEEYLELHKDRGYRHKPEDLKLVPLSESIFSIVFVDDKSSNFVDMCR